MCPEVGVGGVFSDECLPFVPGEDAYLYAPTEELIPLDLYTNVATLAIEVNLDPTPTLFFCRVVEVGHRARDAVYGYTATLRAVHEPLDCISPFGEQQERLHGIVGWRLATIWGQGFVVPSTRKGITHFCHPSLPLPQVVTNLLLSSLF